MAKKPVIPIDLIFEALGAPVTSSMSGQFMELSKTKGVSKDPKHTQNIFQNLCLKIIKNKALMPEFKKLKLYTLGSLSYGGLCPYSDVDLLAVGDKDLTEKFSVELAEQLSNVKIKWWPKLDFNLAADVFDHVSLFFLKELFEDDKVELELFKSTQHQWITKHLDLYQMELKKDRHLRRSRYGDVGGELAPNLKYGPGGLRDSCQALAWLGWSSAQQEKFQRERAGALAPHNCSSELDSTTSAVHLHQTLTQNLVQIFELRFALQLLFQTDQLSLEHWIDLQRLKPHSEDFKKSSYRILYTQFFLTDLIFQNNSLNLIDDLEHLQKEVLSNDLKKIIINYLNPMNSKALAYLLRTDLSQTKANMMSQKDIYQFIQNIFLQINENWQIDFLLDSGLLGEMLSDWNYIFGLTQSDHYHKYTVSEHLRQTLKAVCHLQTEPDLRFSMHASSEELRLEDWALLKWVAIFHDLKKGHKEDHSILGRDVVDQFEFFSPEQKSVVSCLVEHHLRLSSFAFRFEHSDLAQLESLNQVFETSHWIRLLLIFTGADIIGSNPQAWNKWKSDQLYFAYKSLMDYRNNRIYIESHDLEGFELSPQLAKVIGVELLQEDILLLKKSAQKHPDLDDWLVESIDQNLWVRVFKKDSGPGTLSQILNILYLAGLPVEQAFIASSSEGFVYNWFRLPSTFAKPKSQIQKRLKILNEQPLKQEKTLMAQVDKVIFLTENKDKLSFLFKGQDQNGVLLYISQIFASHGVNIQKAQINTWGQRLEDLFVVKKEDHDAQFLLQKLQQSLKLPQSIKI